MVWLFCWIVSCAAGLATRDQVSESQDVRMLDAGGSAENGQGYEYVARRPLAVVALAEARGIAPDVARQAVNRLADALDACATNRSHGGAPAQGAARVVAPIDDSGSVGTPGIRIDPGAGAAESTVLCLVAPLKLLRFPPSHASARGIAIEALWGQIVPAR